MQKSLYFSGVAIFSPSICEAAVVASPEQINQVWLIVCIALVLLMQVGFMLLEVGATRSKNAVSAAFKNKADLCLSLSLFFAVGSILAFGPSVGGLFGADRPDASTQGNILILLYQAAFCATAATLISGATAERMTIMSYLTTVGAVALIIYPVVVHWGAGALFVPENAPFLASLGFVDYAGSTIVHGTGAWIALAAIMALGPRLGRFDPETKQPRYLDGYSPNMSMVGTIILLIGWLGFNGGASLAFDENVPKVLINTVVGGLWGASLALIICLLLNWKLHPVRMIEGTIAGLVSITAAPHFMSITGAVVVSSIAVIIAIWARGIILRMGLDDVVNVVATHGVAGVVGTLAVAFVAPTSALPTGSHLEQFGIQALGVISVFVWSFGLSVLWFRMLNWIIPLRVETLDEERGLSFASHNVGFSADRFARELEELLRSDQSDTKRVHLPEGDENERLAQLFNKMLDDLEANRKREQAEAARREADEKALRASAEEKTRAAQTSYDERKRRENAERNLRQASEQLVEQTKAQLETSLTQAQMIASFVTSISEGNLATRIPSEERPEAFETIAEGINSLVTELSENIGGIAASADEVMRSCVSLEEISTKLQQRSGSQLDSVQAITFRLSRMTDAAELNAKLSTEALDLASESEAVSSDITDGLSEISRAMEAITDRTSKIEPIANLIEEIAFQTTLLALNASVEAARAGSHGRGFSVVAQEVRSLADRVHGSASEIRHIVEKATETVSRGGQKIQETSQRVATVGDTSRRVSGQITDIHSSSSELVSQLTDLGKVVEEITAAASANSVIAGEASDGAETLSNLGRRLLDSIASFRGYREVGRVERKMQEDDSQPKETLMFF